MHLKKNRMTARNASHR